MNSYKIVIFVGVGIIGVMAALFGLDLLKMSFGSQDFEIYVDPLIDKQSLFVTGRVTIQNVGMKPLTNVRVNFGDGDVLELGTLDPREKIILSPPPDNSMQFVQVSADPDIFVNKAYREMPKMVGMMGS